MILKKFSVYDVQAASYLTPFFAPTSGLAIRSFMEAANTEGHNFKRYAADYTLFELGSFDDATGRSTELDAPHNHGTALHFMAADTPTAVPDLNRTAREG